MSIYGKIRKIILFTVCGLLAAILVTTLVCVIYANSGKGDPIEPTEFYSTWMSHIEDNTLVKDIVIPGSHDAGTVTMDWLSETQNKDLAEQLSYGTRYFDVRVEKLENGDLVIFHGPSRGVAFEPLLRQVRTFLQNNPSETVILDFQHFAGNSFDDVNEKLSTILTTNMMVRNTSSSVQDIDYIDSLTLKNARGKCIVFWGSDSNSNLENNYIFKRNNDGGTRAFSALHSFYQRSFNTMSSRNYIERGIPEYISLYKQVNKGLFVLQGQLTDGAYVFGPLFRERQHNDNMNAYIQSLQKSSDLPYINIIMRDFVNCTKNSYALELNLFNKTVKSASIETFATALQDFIDVSYQLPQTEAE